MKSVAAIALLVLLAGCGRDQPLGSFLNPVCLADGSVALRQLPDEKGEYATPRATKENCPWNKPDAKK
jgi:hypothetical protein